MWTNQYFVWFKRGEYPATFNNVLRVITPGVDFDFTHYGIDGSAFGQFFDGEWHHLAATSDKLGSNFFFDGALVQMSPPFDR